MDGALPFYSQTLGGGGGVNFDSHESPDVAFRSATPTS